MLPSHMLVVTFKQDEPTNVYLVTHTYEWDSEATEALRNYVTRWLITAEGRRFAREHNIDGSGFPWDDMFQLTKVLEAAPGITKVEALPYTVCPAYEDDNVSPWYFLYSIPRHKHYQRIDKEKLRDLPETGAPTCQPTPTPSTQP